MCLLTGSIKLSIKSNKSQYILLFDLCTRKKTLVTITIHAIYEKMKMNITMRNT